MWVFSWNLRVKTHFQSVCCKYLGSKPPRRDFLTGDQRSKIRDRGPVANTFSSAQRVGIDSRYMIFNCEDMYRYAYEEIIVSVSLKSISSFVCVCCVCRYRIGIRHLFNILCFVKHNSHLSYNYDNEMMVINLLSCFQTKINTVSNVWNLWRKITP